MLYHSERTYLLPQLKFVVKISQSMIDPHIDGIAIICQLLSVVAVVIPLAILRMS
jgi:hypothetical protein